PSPRRLLLPGAAELPVDLQARAAALRLSRGDLREGVSAPGAGCVVETFRASGNGGAELRGAAAAPERRHTGAHLRALLRLDEAPRVCHLPAEWPGPLRSRASRKGPRVHRHPERRTGRATAVDPLL